MTYLLIFVTSSVLTLVLTPFMRSICHRMGWVDLPDQGRKLHRIPMPRLGGIPIAISFIISVGMLHFLHGSLATIYRAQSPLLYKVLPAAMLVLALGAWDDIKGTSPYTKIVVQVIAAYWLYYGGIAIQHIGVPGTAGIKLGIFTLPVTILWVVGVTNALNLVDGLDGLASGVAFFAAITIFVVSILQHNTELGILTISLSGATLAFLRFNFNPATMFLGDSGAMFLGFLLAAFSMIWATKAPTLVAVVAPLFALGLPIAEVGISVFRRFVRGQPVFAADGEHIHHRLLGQGMSTRQAVLLLYGVCALLGTSSLLLATVFTREIGLVLLVLVAAGWLGIQQLGYHEFGEVGDSLRRGLFLQRRAINAHVRLRNMDKLFSSVNTWPDFIATLRDLGHELGYVEITLDLSGRRGTLPLGIPRSQAFPCVEDSLPFQGRCWRIEIPIGSDPNDASCLVLTRPLASGQTPYLVQVMVESLSNAMPPILDRLLSSRAA